MAHFLVRSTSNDGRVVLWERNAVHPDGEVFVSGAAPVLAGMTPRVQGLLYDGRLELVGTEDESGSEGGVVGGGPPIADNPPPALTEAAPATTVDPGNLDISTMTGAVEADVDMTSAAEAGAKTKGDEDHELLAIDGISETRLKALQHLGVNSYADLLASNSVEIAGYLPRVSVAMVDGWKKQASALAAQT